MMHWYRVLLYVLYSMMQWYRVVLYVVILFCQHRERLRQIPSTISDRLCIIQRPQLEQHIVEKIDIQCNYMIHSLEPS